MLLRDLFKRKPHQDLGQDIGPIKECFDIHKMEHDTERSRLDAPLALNPQDLIQSM